MDHAINSLRTYFELSMEELHKEWESDQYRKLSACPTYKECSAYSEAINVLKKHLYGDDFEAAPLQETLEGYIWMIKKEHIAWK